VHVEDAREADALDEDSIQLVVTSPPYPMIEMWDELFADLDPGIGTLLDEERDQAALERMHAQLDRVWATLARVLEPGGIACINVGDATRSLGEGFQLYPNAARVTDRMMEHGFEPLPDIVWRKPANSPNKFVGSGMLPPNAYATLEHESILVFRNGSQRRSFEPHAERRYEAAYFWEERNDWFSDVWTDVRGTLQALDRDELRERSAAYPLEIPFRLISMFSTYDDTVLDPFWGTGTTTLAAMATARSSIGLEIEEEFVAAFEQRLDRVDQLSHQLARKRLDRHRSFVDERRERGDPPAYEAEHYPFGVVTKQERAIRLYGVENVEETAEGYLAEHEPIAVGS